MSEKSSYDMKSAKLPYLAGGVLKLFVSLLTGPLGRLLIPNLFQTAGITDYRKVDIDDPPTMKPIHHTGHLHTVEAAVPKEQLPGPPDSPAPGFHFTTTHDYAAAFREGKTTPEEVAQRVIEAIKDSNSREIPLRAIIASYEDDVLEQAKASAERIKRGAPLSIFDGVPVAIKDELDMVPYPTTVGTPFLGASPAVEDSTVVTRLRKAGALLIGKANMHEIGLDVTGLNPHHGTTRNPYSLDHYPGGSSSGPSAAVAAGLAPLAVGADGGGSIRLPAAFCGVVGLKSTFGRVSEYGAAPLCWSVAHLGPIAATATDTALAWGILAGPDPKEPDSLHQPLPTLVGWDNLDLSDLTLGVFWPWFRHATQDMVDGCEAMLEYFESLGAKVIEVELPDLEMGRVAHLVSIAGEIAQVMDEFHAEHGKEHGLGIRTNLRLARAFTAQDYVKAQRVRTRLMVNFNKALEIADVIVTPAAGLPAPEIKPKALPLGDSDLTVTAEVMRYAPPANMTGLPAITFPVGYNKIDLPLSMQVMGKAWDERTLLRMALAAEQKVIRQAPDWHYDILGG